MSGLKVFYLDRARVLRPNSLNFPESISDDNSDDDDYDDNDDGADDAKRRRRKWSNLCGREVDETGQMFSFGGGEIFLLLETALQLVHLSCCH